MLGRLRTAAKFFAWGLLLGLLFAPASGQELRRRMVRWVMGCIEARAAQLRERFSGTMS
ncbi:YtxH domain-containing protein [Thermomicrobium sp. CFH 73360]|uniref:YtxH domain-containing protein n=1 Tax=Thermomicrobium sp. CFH 73360 TaxID=2951987 RepID=UPI0020768D77|nr:YtxH domain-containing protein [Thermomicrobium sp. CFH 73360]MCM8745421.1 YtxH domain-containing protein [Thermomicrobium sp. CFH 73360]